MATKIEEILRISDELEANQPNVHGACAETRMFAEMDLADACGFDWNLWAISSARRARPSWTPREVTGWRYGNLPSGQSRNFRDDSLERGVSLAALDNGKEVGAFSQMFFDDRPVVRVRGILLPWMGSDGEPLVCCAEEI